MQTIRAKMLKYLIFCGFLIGSVVLSVNATLAVPVNPQRLQTGIPWSSYRNWLMNYGRACAVGRCTNVQVPNAPPGQGVVQNQQAQMRTGLTLDSFSPLRGAMYSVRAGIPCSAIRVADLTRRDFANIEANMYRPSGYPATGTDFLMALAAASNLRVALDHSPESVMNQAEAVGQAQATQAGDASADCARAQSAGAISFCSSYLQNFTTQPQWNMIRDQIFIPMAILLLLPGAVLAQMRAVVAAGSPVLGEVNPFEGILRSIIAIFLIPGTALVVNYGIDLNNSIAYTINTEYSRIFGTDMYKDALCAEMRATPVRQTQSNRNALDLQTYVGRPLLGSTTAFGQFEGMMMENSLQDPCAGIDMAPPQAANEAMSSGSAATRLMMNGSNAGLAAAWNVLCAFQLAYLYYLWCVGPIMAALWVYPLRTLRNALPSWVEGVVTLCFWSLFWNTVILLMACFKGVDETGTMIMTALNFLATASVKYAFDFAGLVKAAGQEAAGIAAGQAKNAAHAGGGGAGRGNGAGGQHQATPRQQPHSQGQQHRFQIPGLPDGVHVADASPGPGAVHATGFNPTLTDSGSDLNNVRHGFFGIPVTAWEGFNSQGFGQLRVDPPPIAPFNIRNAVACSDDALATQILLQSQFGQSAGSRVVITEDPGLVAAGTQQQTLNDVISVNWNATTNGTTIGDVQPMQTLGVNGLKPEELISDLTGGLTPVFTQDISVGVAGSSFGQPEEVVQVSSGGQPIELPWENPLPELGSDPIRFVPGIGGSLVATNLLTLVGKPPLHDQDSVQLTGFTSGVGITAQPATNVIPADQVVSSSVTGSVILPVNSASSTDTTTIGDRIDTTTTIGFDATPVKPVTNVACTVNDGTDSANNTWAFFSNDLPIDSNSTGIVNSVLPQSGNLDFNPTLNADVITSPRQIVDTLNSAGAITSSGQIVDALNSAGAITSSGQIVDTLNSAGAITSPGQIVDTLNSAGAITSSGQIVDTLNSTGVVTSSGAVDSQTPLNNNGAFADDGYTALSAAVNTNTINPTFVESNSVGVQMLDSSAGTGPALFKIDSAFNYSQAAVVGSLPADQTYVTLNASSSQGSDYTTAAGINYSAVPGELSNPSGWSSSVAGSGSIVSTNQTFQYDDGTAIAAPALQVVNDGDTLTSSATVNNTNGTLEYPGASSTFMQADGNQVNFAPDPTGYGNAVSSQIPIEATNYAGSYVSSLNSQAFETNTQTDSYPTYSSAQTSSQAQIAAYPSDTVDASWTSFFLPGTTVQNQGGSQDYIYNNGTAENDPSSGSTGLRILDSWFAPESAPVEVVSNFTPDPAPVSEQRPEIGNSVGITMPIAPINLPVAAQSAQAPGMVAYQAPKPAYVSAVNRLTAAMRRAVGEDTQPIDGDNPPPQLGNNSESLQSALFRGNQRGGRIYKPDAEDEAAMRARLDAMTGVTGGNLV